MLNFPAAIPVIGVASGLHKPTKRRSGRCNVTTDAIVFFVIGMVSIFSLRILYTRHWSEICTVTNGLAGNPS